MDKNQVRANRIVGAFLSAVLSLNGIFVSEPTFASAATKASGGVILSTLKIASGTANGPVLADGDDYGISSAGIGDVDHDGVPDIAATAFLDATGGAQRGAVYIHFMNANGTVKSTVKHASGTTNVGPLANGDRYGTNVAGLGDIDQDGVPDIAVGVQSDDTGGGNRGAVYVELLNANGSIKSSTKIASGTTNFVTLANNDSFGTGLAGIGDVDHDGVPDLGAGAPNDSVNGPNRGAVYLIFLNANGSVKATHKIDGATANGPTLADETYYGSITGIGDLDDDGVVDVAVGALGAAGGGAQRGEVDIHFLNADGSVKGTVVIDSTTANGPSHVADGEAYGYYAAGIGDTDLDGNPDLAVGFFSVTDGTGEVYIHLLNANGSVKRSYLIISTATNGAGGDPSFSYLAVSSLGDINGDGTNDIGIGAWLDGTGGTSRGALFVHFMRPVVSTTSNKMILSRLAPGVAATLDVSYALSSGIDGILTITLPAAFAVTGAFTGGTCSGGGTIGAFAFSNSAKTLTAAKTNCSGTVTLTGATVTNPVAAGSYVIRWVNDDPGETQVVIVADTITVNAVVDPQITFVVWADTADCAYGGTSGVYTVALGTLTAGAVTSSDPQGGSGTVRHICVQLDTNAANGAVVTVDSQNDALKSSSVPADIIPSDTSSTVAGTSDYGMCLNYMTIQSTTPAGTFRASGASQDEWGGSNMVTSGATTTDTSTTCTGSAHATTTNFSGGTQPLLNTSADGVAQGVATYLLKAAISGTQPAHSDYTDLLTFVATGTF